MGWNRALANLRDVLADLFLDVADSRRIVQDAGLNPALITFDNKPKNNWHNILMEAHQRNKVPAIIEIVQKMYPSIDELAKAKSTYLQSMHATRLPSAIAGSSKHFAKYVIKLKKLLKPRTEGLPNLNCVELTLDENNRRIKNRSSKENILKTLNNKGNFLLLGESGSGKTTSLNQIAQHYCERRDRIPIIYHLTRYDSQPLEDIVTQKIYEVTGQSIDVNFVRDCLSNGIFIFLFDGLNEVTGQKITGNKALNKMDIVLDHLYTFIFKDFPRNMFIVACRNSSDPKGRIPIKSYQLEPLEEKQIENYLKWKKMSDLFNKLRKSEKLFALCRNPLMLNLTIRMYELKKKKLPENKTELYEYFFHNILYGWETKIIGFSGRLLDVEKILSKIAYEFVPYGTTVKVDFFFKSMRKACKSPQLYIKRSEERYYTKIIIKADLIRIDGISCKFSHPSFQEFLAAKELCNLFDNGNKIDDNIIRKVTQNKSWLEPLIFLSGLLDDSSNLINAVKKYNLFSAGECIIAAKKVSNHLRAEIIKELVQLVDHPNNNIHWGAADILHRIGKRACDLILEELEHGKKKSLRRRLFWVVGRFHNPKVEQTLVKKMNELDEHTLIHVLIGLQDFRPTKPISTLKPLFDHQNPIVRAESAEVYKIIFPDDVRKGESIQLNALDSLLPLLKHREYWVRMHAALVMGKIPSKRPIPALIETLNDRIFSVQWHSILAISKLGDESTVSILNKKIKSNPKNKELFERVINAIESGINTRAALSKSWA